jgi:uncharacterized protein YcfL
VRTWLPVISIALVSLAGCQSADSRARQLQQQKVSWEATVRLTTQLSNQHVVPAEYTQQVLEAAAQGLEQIRQRAAKLSQ